MKLLFALLLAQSSLIAFSQETTPEVKRISFSVEGINLSNEGDIKIIKTITKDFFEKRPEFENGYFVVEYNFPLDLNRVFDELSNRGYIVEDLDAN